MKFVKKPIIVGAVQWFKNGDHPQDDVFRPFEDTGAVPTAPREGEVVRYFRRPDVADVSVCPHCGRIMVDHGFIDTVQGGHTVCPGDWIINEPWVKGYYPCKPDVFEATYTAQEQDTQRSLSAGQLPRAQGPRFPLIEHHEREDKERKEKFK